MKSKTSKADNTENWNIEAFQVPEVPGKMRFHDFHLHDVLMRAIFDLKFHYCTPIQAEILEHTLKGLDAIGKAQTGTGKTAAFLITAMNQLLDIPAPKERYIGEPRVLILAPTRELAIQITEDAEKLNQYTKFNILMLVGGMDMDKQQKNLESAYIDIMIATPGRLIDWLSRQAIFLDLVETLVIDEADRMLDMGFIPQISRILLRLPKSEDRQTLFFSATFNDDIVRLTKKWTCHPIFVDIKAKNAVTDTIDQKIYIVTAVDKFKLLCHLIQDPTVTRLIVFVNLRITTRKLTEKLKKLDFKVGCLSGDIPQKKRILTLDQFKSGKINILVATDVAGRGIHVEGVSHVINYNLPEDTEDYVHRVGRTGRAGSQGVSISFACENDAFLIDGLEKKLGQKIAMYNSLDILNPTN
ncbi:MAG: DEAD/DEAH box helicase [Endozoicomonadaceae bacterium]|nr:DEAD/DEAH box helicase [Endozoicomonadaceae bacterium]